MFIEKAGIFYETLPVGTFVFCDKSSDKFLFHSIFNIRC